MKTTRKSNRLLGFDYSKNGAYFVTICVKDRKPILAHICHEYAEPLITPLGVVVQRYVQAIPSRFPQVTVERCMIMPDHIHLLMTITNGTGDPSPTLGEVVAWLKYNSTKSINQARNTFGKQVFQRSYYDHVIRNKEDYDAAWEYIENNPIKWKMMH